MTATQPRSKAAIDNYRKVLEGMEFQDIDSILDMTEDQAFFLGQAAKVVILKIIDDRDKYKFMYESVSK